MMKIISRQSPVYFLFMFCLILTVATEPSSAQWTQVGIQGQSTRVLITKGKTIYAGTVSGGIYKSTNDGGTWEQSGCANEFISTLYTNGGDVFAGTGGNGIFVSGNDGLSWDSIGLTGHTISSLTTHSTFIFAGTGTDGVYRKSHGSVEWEQVNNGITDKIGMKLATFNDNLFAAGTGFEVFRSSNDGLIWSNIGNLGFKVRGFAVQSALFAGSEGGIFLYKGDNSWDPLNNGLTNLVIISLSSHSGFLFAGTASGLFISPDHGNNWTLKAEGLLYKSILTATSNDTYIFIANSQGIVYRTLLDKGISVFLPLLSR